MNRLTSINTTFGIVLTMVVCLPQWLTAQTDYSQMTNWYYHPYKLVNFIESYSLDIAVIDKDLQVDSIIQIENNSGTNTGVDVFWVHPTHLTNPPAYPTSVAISNQDGTYISLAILGQGALLAKYGRFYAPKYRQASPSSFLGFGYSEVTRAAALLDTYGDIKAAFSHYLNHHNNGNKIILAGHSQGSFLLAMLLRDFFDEDPQLREQLVTASLGGMGYVYATPGSVAGGWWENIPLCTTSNECGCVHYWRSYEERKAIPAPNPNTPSFSQTLVDSGLVYRTTDINKDNIIQDSLFYGTESSPLRYYITPDANYNLAAGYNIIAFDSLYTARFKRESNLKVGLVIERVQDTSDYRPNDIDSNQTNPFFQGGDLHIKDYHIYIWSLLQQIDSKLRGCHSPSTGFDSPVSDAGFMLYPNPSNGQVTVKMNEAISKGEETTIRILTPLGQLVQTVTVTADEHTIQIDSKGVYYLISNRGHKTLIIE